VLALAPAATHGSGGGPRPRLQEVSANGNGLVRHPDWSWQWCRMGQHQKELVSDGGAPALSPDLGLIRAGWALLSAWFQE
jgi:hypothetical protein